MAILVFEHEQAGESARLGAVLGDHGHRLRVVQLYRGQAMPVDLDDVDAILSMGGPMNVGDADEHPWMQPEIDLLRQAHERDIPIVGICLGAQLLASALGGEVAAMENPEVGWHRVRLAFPGTTDPLLAGTPWNSMQFHMHGQEVVELPPDAVALAGSAACRTQAFKVGLRSYGFQYHFELMQADIDELLTKRHQWLTDAAVDVDAVRRAHDEHYPMYRHLSDRLAHNIAQLLVPIDKRLVGARSRMV